MAAKFFYQENTLASVVASGRASRYVRTKEVILCDRSGDGSPASLLACELSGTVSVAASQNKLLGFRYTPYGRRFETLSEATQLGFNGEYLLPGLALYLLGNGYRAYNPGTMRFVSPDSISPFHALNAYSYCSNDPTNKADPSGHIELRHLNKLKANLKVVKAATAKIDMHRESIMHLGKTTQLKHAQAMVSQAKLGMQEAFVKAGPEYGWLLRKLHSAKYDGHQDKMISSMEALRNRYIFSQRKVDEMLEGRASEWAKNEAKIDVEVEKEMSRVRSDAKQS